MRHSIILSSFIALFIIGAASCSKSDNSNPNPNPPGGKDTTDNPTIPVDSNAGKTGTVTFTYRGQLVTYTTVIANEGRTWLQQNLGSSRVATSQNDNEAYGHFFQWGRWDDGHQLPNSPSEQDAALNFAALNGGDSIFRVDWMKNTGAATDKWEAATPADVTATVGCDPCKAIGAGWRMPTKAEWDTLRVREGITNTETAYASNLKLSHSGIRNGITAQMSYSGLGSSYWSGTASGYQNGYGSAWAIGIGDQVTILPYNPYFTGIPIRCILQK
jgi:uncharacterized protein (TIGR02145 family)